MKVSPHDKAAKGEQVTEYYRSLPEDSPVPPDETKTHIFKNLIKREVIAEPSVQILNEIEVDG